MSEVCCTCKQPEGSCRWDDPLTPRILFICLCCEKTYCHICNGCADKYFDYCDTCAVTFMEIDEAAERGEQWLRRRMDSSLSL